MAIEAFPLQWPLGFERTRTPERHPLFRRTKTFGQERDALIRELSLLEVRNIIISSNIPLKQDGYPYANFQRQNIPDRGIAVYFTMDVEQKVVACDAWDSFEHNVRALTLTIESMRALGRYKCSQILGRMFTGFKALPEQAAARKWWEVLGCSKDANAVMIRTAYRLALHSAHPDKGGTSERFQEVQEAYKQATK